MADAPVIVLDTNTVMALWFFEDPLLAPLRQAIDRSPVTLATRADAIEELRRVLTYRQFAIDGQRQQAILSAYARRCMLVESRQDGGASLPSCRDPDDQKFLEIARDCGATHLVSRDKALLKLHRHRLIRPRFIIITPERFCAELYQGAQPLSSIRPA